MSDMTLCPGGGCPQRRQCLRHRRRAHGRRVSFSAPPFDPDTGRCSAFIDIDSVAPTEEQIRARAYHLWLAAGRPEGADRAHWLQAEAALAAAYEEGLTE